MKLRLLVSLLTVLLCACSPQKGPETASGHKLKIAFVPMHLFDVYWQTVHAGAIKAAHERDINLVWQGPITANARADEIDIVDNMVGTVPDALVVGPVDFKALTGPVRNAHNMGMPVIIIDSPLDGHDYQGYVGTDNYAGGVSGGHHLAKLLNGKGRVAILRGVEGTASTDAREKGFLDAIAKYPEIKVVSQNIRGGENAETARAAAENILQPLRQSDGSYAIDGVFASMESLSYGMMLALDSVRLSGKVKFVGFDFSKQLVQGLSDGKIDALVTQNPVELGYKGVIAAIDAAQGKPVVAVDYIPTVIVTTDNLHNPAVWERVNPDLSKVQ
jgi:ribose transport system substrate-binding protein